VKIAGHVDARGNTEARQLMRNVVAHEGRWPE
jgi:hypothetical protein